MNQTEMRDILVAYYKDSELRDLCFYLGIDYESLPGEGKAARARELVAYCQRRDRLPELEAACRRLRPNAFKDGRSASAEPAAPPKTEGQPAGTVVHQSGGVTINAQTVNVAPPDIVCLLHAVPQLFETANPFAAALQQHRCIAMALRLTSTRTTLLGGVLAHRCGLGTPQWFSPLYCPSCTNTQA